MRGQAGFFDVDARLKDLSAKGDALERLNAIVDVELFRPDLARRCALGRPEGQPACVRSGLHGEGADPAGEPLALR